MPDEAWRIYLQRIIVVEHSLDTLGCSLCVSFSAEPSVVTGDQEAKADLELRFVRLVLPSRKSGPNIPKELMKSPYVQSHYACPYMN